ncbi:MAG: glycosyltransferase family 2 protein, partial [Acidimicrobiales bacterium]
MDSPLAAESPGDHVQALAPRVEIVMVAHEPGGWFDETLASFRAQDYTRLHTTVLAASAVEPIAARVGPVLPDATVRQVEAGHGYGWTANAMLSVESPPAFYLFCHDDVALAPDAVRLLVDEALRSNASVVGPKLVRWDRPEELLDVGVDVDKLGYVAPRVEPGELDQEQHDAVADVFVVSGAVQLVRADLFHALEGFDETMGVTGEDVDFCWRAHVAGARVLAVPSAVVRHRAGMGSRRSKAEIERLSERHRLRTLLSVYGVGHSVRVIPQAVLYSAIRTVGTVLTGHFASARAAVGAWTWNLARPGSLLRRRSLLSDVRKLPDSEIRRLQVRGFAPVSSFLRGTLTGEGGGSIAARARNIVRSLRSGPSRVSLAFWALTIVLFVFGSRHLITRQVPVIGDLVPFDLGPSDLFDRWFDSWRSTGTGQEAAAPTALGIVGILGVPFLGFMGLLRTVLTLGMLPIGGIGMWRFLSPFSSPWIRVVGSMMYLASPVPYNALTNGSWGALLLFGLLPWVLAGIARAGRLAPFGRLGGAVGEGILEPAWT